MTDLNRLLSHLVEQRGSDLHLKVGSVPHLRVRGRLRATPFEPSTMEEISDIIAEVIPTGHTRKLTESGEISIAHSVSGLGRFRVNVYRQRGSHGLSVRLVPAGAPELRSLGLPPAVTALADLTEGLVLVTGHGSSGRTTTVAAMLDHINRNRPVHIVTLEDPIEVLLPDRKALVSQREIGVDTRSAADAMRRVNRLDPDVIFVADPRDAETFAEMLWAAIAGRLVVATMSTVSVAETLAHLIERFEPADQPRMRRALASALAAVVSQQLVDGLDGQSRVVAVELLLGNRELSDILIRGGQTEEIVELMENGSEEGMQTMEQALITLGQAGRIPPQAGFPPPIRSVDLGQATVGRPRPASGG